MLIIKREIESDYIFKYIDRQGTKNLTLWKYFLKKGNLMLHDQNGFRTKALDISDMKVIKEIKKVMDSYPFKWEFQISPQNEGDGYILQGFNFIIPKTEIVNSQYSEYKTEKENLILFCSLNTIRTSDSGHRLKISQSSILTNVFENHMVKTGSGEFVVHPHVSTNVSKASCKDSDDPYHFQLQMQQYIENCGYFINVPQTNICLGSGDTGNTIRGIFFAKQEEFPITMYIEALLTICEQESEEGVPYCNIHSLTTLNDFNQSRTVPSRVTSIRDALGITRFPYNGRYYSSSIVTSIQGFKGVIEDDILESSEILEKLNFKFNFGDPPELVESPELDDLVDSLFLVLTKGFRETLMITDINQANTSLHVASKEEVDTYVEYLKEVLETIEKSNKNSSLTKFVTFEQFYFKFEGVKYPFKKNVINKNLDYLSKEDQVRSTIEFFENKNYRIPRKEIITEIKNTINAKIRNNTKEMVKESFVARAKSSLKSREKCLFED